MEGRRRGETDSEALRLARPGDAETKACAGEPGSSSLAFLDGKWAGETADGREIQLEVIPVMGGCVLLEFLTVGGDRLLEEFRVRAYQTGNSNWAQFAVSNQTEGLVEYVGEAAEGRLAWSLPGASEIVESWRLDDKKNLRLNRTQSNGQVLSASLASAL
jgi:hypothetical protein